MSTALDWAGVLTGPVGVGLGIWAKGVFDRKVSEATAVKTEAEGAKIDADAAKVIADTAVALVAPLQKQITALTTRVKNLEDENAASTGKLRRAVNYIKDLLLWISERSNECPPPPPADLGI